MNSDTNLYTLSKRVLDDFIALNSFRWRKEAQKTGIANSQYLKRTQKHIIIYSISIFFFLSGLWGFGCCFFIPHFSLCSFEHHWFIFCTELHWFIFCTIVWVIHTLFSIYLGFDIFSSTEKLRWQWRPRRRQPQCRVR